jgi:hypothetical protein
MIQDNNQSGEHNSELISADLDQFQHQSPQRRRRRFLVYSVLSIILIISLIIAVLHGMRFGGLLAWIPTPTSTPSPATAVKITSNINWGTVRLNGKIVKTKNGAPAMPMGGRNTITLDAPPFNHTACTFTWPDLRDLVGPDIEGKCVNAGSQNGYTLIGIDDTFHDLPDTEQQRIRTFATSYIQQLTQSTEVHVGDHYAAGYGTNREPIIQQAMQSMQVQFAIQLANSASECGDMICPSLSVPSLTANTHDWQIKMDLIGNWQFIDTKGAIIAEIPTFFDQNFTLHYTSDGTWTMDASPPIHGTICLSLLSPYFPYQQSTYTTYSINNVANIEGCKITVTSSNNGEPAMKFLVRFGAILAMDDSTASHYPDLPRATPAEIAAVG